jgi:transcriptional regulator with AAA-type ATPase domain/tetratricopeptide (TPR) repeat protein
MDESVFIRFRKDHQKIVDQWNGNEVQPLVLPSTPDNLKKAHAALNVLSNHVQNLVYYDHDPFEIHAWTEPLPEASPKTVDVLNPMEAKRIFLQAMAVAETADDLGIDFIDFSNPRVSLDRNVRFPLCLTRPRSPAVPQLRETFNQIPSFKNIGGDLTHPIFRRETAHYRFNEKESYFFKFDTFASHLLNSYSLTGIENEATIKIKIAAKHDRQKIALRNNLYHILHADDVPIVRIDLSETAIDRFFQEALFPKGGGKKKIGEILQEFGLFQKQSIYRKVILWIENLEAVENIDFLKILLNSHEISDFILIAISQDERFDFDLEFREDPPNLMKKFLAFEASPPGGWSREEIEVLNSFRIADTPLILESISQVFPKRLLPYMDPLIEKKCLYVDSRQRTVTLSPSSPEFGITRNERIRLLKSLAEKAGLASARICLCIETGKTSDLEDFLVQYAKQAHRELHVQPVIDVLADHINFLKNHEPLLERCIEILLKVQAIQTAKEWLQKYLPASSVFRCLKLAHVHKLEKNYQQMKACLDEISRPPVPLQDEFHHLKFYYSEKFSDRKNADRHLAKITDDFFRHLSLTYLCDRYIYRGDFSRAERILQEAERYFSEQAFAKEEIEVQSQMGKMLREKGKFQKAEQLYKNIFIRSEVKNFHLLSAYISVDLGNLYLEHDDDLQAENWYHKAIKLFAGEGNSDGDMLVKSNLAEIYIRKGDWKEAETLLKKVLDHDREKGHIASTAIDFFNLAHLEFLRQNLTESLKMCEKSLSLFTHSGNTKGVLENIFLRNKIFFIRGDAADFPEPFHKSFNRDQKCLHAILTQSNGPDPREVIRRRVREAMEKMVSKKMKFETLVLVTQKLQCPDFLDSLRTISIGLASASRNYFYHEYFYAYFSIMGDASGLGEEIKETFRDTFDFFSLNKRKMGASITRLKAQLEENDSRSDLFENARRVDHFHRWKIPDDFFRSLIGEINRDSKIKLIKMTVYETQKKIFHFSSAPQFQELGDEMIEYANHTKQDLHLPLPELQSRFRSRERIFYPYQLTQVIFWKMGKRLHSFLLLAFPDHRYLHVDFFQRNRETFNTFAALFQKFYEVNFQIGSKLDFIVGQSPPIQKLKATIAKVAKVDFSLLITGESGSGKELVAKAVHLLSPRAGKPFVPVNSAAIPEQLLEAELFGYRKGAFTGAAENRIGLIESADQGTLFLDEIADLPLNLQAKLLRVLQESEIRRLGENKTIPVNVRLITATNKNLRELIRSNRFREDLYYRLQDITVSVPPLRERSEDIPVLARYFLAKYGCAQDDGGRIEAVIEQFRNDRFTGNVRELESRIKSLITFDFDFGADVAAGYTPSGLREAKGSFEKIFIHKTLEETSWNRNQTARKLGISRMSLFNLIKKYGLREHESIHQ